MTTKERANFLVNKYGDKSIEVVEEVLSDIEDSDVIRYWNDVRSMCKQLIKENKLVESNRSS
jgi:hypothetical protein